MKTKHVKCDHLSGEAFVSTSMDTFVERFVGPFVGVLEELKTGKVNVPVHPRGETLMGHPHGHCCGCFCGPFLGAPEGAFRSSFLSGSNATPLLSRYSCRATLVSHCSPYFFALSHENRATPLKVSQTSPVAPFWGGVAP